MKNFKKQLSFFALGVCAAFQVTAQDKDNPWTIGVGINIVDVAVHGTSDFGGQIKDYLGTEDFNTLPVFSRLSVARYLDKGFTVDVAGAINSLDKIGSGDVEERTYYSLDFGARYDLNNLFGQTGWFDPYVKFGVGGAWVEDDFAAVVVPSLGFNTWLNESVGLNFESSYKNSDVFGDTNSKWGNAQYIGQQHFQHSISLIIRFGAKDTDKDGITDKKDICPQIAGKKELQGCPDIDGDGIADKDDACPELAGSKETNGCPDTDKDGVIDSKDKCPNKAGTFNGCPDTDNDGVADNVDKCPSQLGPKENNGCPWLDTDNDGVTDNVDKCIQQKGPKTNNGCPVVLTEEAKAKLGSYAKTIQFNSGKSEFKAGVAKTLDAVAAVMKEFEGVKFDVEGHSDSAGNDAKNLVLSQKRAQAVVDYLGSHGIDKSRLHAVGYGETQPIASNKTRAGRAENRRVVLKAIEK